MILLTRFHSGERFAVNPDLIERVEETPDTVITLTNGAKHVVQESLDEISESVQVFKASTLALAVRMIEDPPDGATAHLRIVPAGEHRDPDRGPDDQDPSD
jgi:flagellar protein FlbD